MDERRAPGRASGPGQSARPGGSGRDGSGRDVARLVAGLDDQQHLAVTVDAAPLCILAGAGSGKTRVLTRRIAHRVATGTAHPGRVLALTFTRQAAGELSQRLKHLGVRDRVAAGTFHAVAYAQLRRRWADQGRPAPALLDRKVRVIAPLLPSGSGDGAVAPGDVAAEIEWAKARMVGPDRYEAEAQAAGRRGPLPAPVVAGVYHRYEEEKRRRGLIDFDDLLAQCALAVEQDPEFAAAQRWRFRHLFVDEFQDVNPAQFRLLKAWLGGSGDLCVVGDPHQAIYSWNGADPTLLVRFTERFPSATVVRLTGNYRSSPQVLSVASAVLGGAAEFRPHRPDGPSPRVSSFATDTDEAAGIARMLRTARRPGGRWSDVAVLTRTNAQLALIQQALRRVQIPCRVAGRGSLPDQPEVQAALRRMDRTAPGQPFLAAVADLEADAGAEGDGAAAPAANDVTAPSDRSPAAERMRHLAALARVAREYAAIDGWASVAGFRAWLAATVGDDDAGADAVHLSTFHRAKGLEWPVVVVAGLERGLVPIGGAGDPAAEAEERRLLYVAVTRAREVLHCTWAERRAFGDRSLPRSPSPYLEQILDACRAVHRSGGRDTEAALRHLRRERDRLRSAPRPNASPGADLAARADAQVLDALRRWRTEAARLSGVPAYVILHDATLAAVAAACPASEEELLRLPGVGPVKASRYGDALLGLVARHRASA